MKNRPNDAYIDDPSLKSITWSLRVRAWEKWAEGFERELREEIAYLKSMEPEELYEYIHEFKFEDEVLGE